MKQKVVTELVFRLSTNFENFRTFAQLLKSPMMEYLKSLQLVSFITYSPVSVWKT